MSVAEDIRHDDLEYNPQLEPQKAKAWLNLLRESEDAFENYNDHCDRIDERYANLARLANMQRDKEFQMFWANAEVLKPSIYAKPPIPVVVPKFMDRRPVYQAAAETMERCAVVAFDLAEINELMMLVRDDLALADRGVAWCRYEGGKNEKVAIDFKGRRDFLHSLSANWREVTWVAAASYLTRDEARKRFYPYSGDEYQDAHYKVDKDQEKIGATDGRERAKFWEIWDKTNRRCIWVAEGCEYVLDEGDPELDLRNFFPCPKPAYGTTQRGSLVPVPDVLQYKDQLEELNMLTGKIHALSDALEAKGFYPAGGSELSEAVQAAVNTHTPGRVLVPIANWSQFGGSKEVIIWLPIAELAQTITGLVTLRQQIIQDIYQIMGLSDIMRGATNPQETLGAQQLKTQYGSTRIRDKQQEMVRLARDLVEITTEIITEKFDDVTIVEMSQTQLPTNRMVDKKIQEIDAWINQTQRQLMSPELQQNPQMAQQMMAQAQAQVAQAEDAIQRLEVQPTIDQVLHFLKDRRAKSFVLDIETDSTIVADEQAEKQQRAEFVGVLGQLLPQLSQMIMADPKTADFCGEILKFAVAPYRAGRSLDGSINDLVEQMKEKGNQPQGDDPTTAQNKTALQIEQIKDQTNKEKIKAENERHAAELAQKDKHQQESLAAQKQMKAMELQAKQGDDQAKMQVQNQKMMENRESHQAEMIGKSQEMQLNAQKATMAEQAHQQRQQDMVARQGERQAAQQFKQQQATANQGIV